MSTTPFMGLTEPTVLVTTGPTYATNQNTSFTLVDSHDHSTGKGVKISQTGLLFSGDLSFQNGSNYYGPTNLAYTQFRQQTLQGTGTKLGSLMVNAAGELFYQDGAGNNVQLTSGGVISQTGTGLYNGIYGNYAAAGPTNGASISFLSASSTYGFYTTWQAGTPFGNTYAILAGSEFRSYQTGVSGNYGGISALKADGTQGWTLHNNAGTSFYLSFNPAGSAVTAYTVVPTGVNNQYLFGFNRPAASYPLEVSFCAQGNESSGYPMGRFIQLTNGNGAPANGFGMSWRYEASIVEGTGATPSIICVQDMTWKTVSTRIGRWRMFGYSGGSSDATAGIELIGGGPAIGVGTTAVTGTPLSVGAVGGVSASFSGSVTVPTFSASGLITGTAGLTISAGATQLVGTTITGTGLTVNSSSGLTVSQAGATITGNSSVAGTFSNTTAATLASSSGNVSIAAGGGNTSVGGILTVTGAVTSASAASGISVAGSAAAPAWFIGTAANTGLYQPGTHQLGFSTNGTLSLTLDASQNATFAGTISSGSISSSGSFTLNSASLGSTINLPRTSVSTTPGLGSYNINSFCSNFCAYTDSGLAQTYNLAGSGQFINNSAGNNTIKLTAPISTNAVFFAIITDTTGKTCSVSTSDRQSFTIINSDTSSHTVTFVVLGG